jgi:hypothetical protein
MIDQTSFYKKSKSIFVILLILGAFALGLWIASRTTHHEPYCWRNLCPGMTKISEAVNRLGKPDEIQTRGSYQIFLYKERDDLGRRRVELWFEPESDDWVVRGIYMMGTPKSDQGVKEDFGSLESLLVHYGKPDWVKWTTICYTRSLIWSDYGIAAGVGVGHSSSNLDEQSYWREFPITEILFFEPMPKWKFQFTPWPWPGYSASWVRENMCVPPYNAPETLPKDPFDWSRFTENLQKS